MLPYNTHFSFQVDYSEMDSDDDVQEIDPTVITRSGRKKYRRKILKESSTLVFVVAAKDITTMRKNAKTKMILTLLMSKTQRNKILL
jgi:hypothetical protein